MSHRGSCARLNDVPASLIETNEVVNWYEGKLSPDIGRTGCLKWWLLPAQDFLQKSSSQLTHLFLVSQGAADASRAEVPEGRLPEVRFEFNEDVEHGWSDVEILCGDREQISAPTSPEERPAVRKAHRGLGHTVTSKFLTWLRLGGATTATLAVSCMRSCQTSATSFTNDDEHETLHFQQHGLC